MPVRTNLGLYLDRPPLSVPDGALQDGHNFRIRNGRVTNENLGYTRFGSFTLNGPVTLIDEFITRSGASHLIFGTPTDLYRYVSASSVVYLTPIYATGTVDVSAANPAVVTTDTGTPNWSTTGIKAGDEISFGAADENDPAATWYVVDTVDGEDQITLTTAVTGAPLSAQAYTIRRLFTGDIGDWWDTEKFIRDDNDDDLWFATNGVDHVVTWDGSDAQVTSLSSLYTGTGLKCKILVAYSNMMIYANITDDGTGEASPNSFINSDVGDPDDLANGLANEFRISSGSEAILNAHLLGDSLVFYIDGKKHGRIVLAQFVGDPLVFAFRTGVDDVGPIGGRLIANFGDYHEFLAPDSAYRFDGIQLRPSVPQVMREVLRARDPARPEQGFAFFDEETGTLLWGLPLTTDLNGEGVEVAYAEHYLEDVGTRNPTPVSRRALPFTVMGYWERTTSLTWADLTDQWKDLNFRWNDQFFNAAFPLALAGDKDGKIYTYGDAQTADTAAMASYVIYGRRALSDGRARDLLRRVYPFATKQAAATEDLTVTTRLFDHASGDVDRTSTETFDMTLPEGGHFVSVFRAGRFVEVRFSTENQRYELEGYETEVTPGGRR